MTKENNPMDDNHKADSENTGSQTAVAESAHSSAKQSDSQSKNVAVKQGKLKPYLHLIVNIALVILVGIVAFLSWARLSAPQTANVNAPSSEKADTADNTTEDNIVSISTEPFTAENTISSGIFRVASLHTTIPTRPRADVITYTVKTGDSLFSIADSFGLKPETLLWGNFDVLQDNPHLLKPGQILNILPVDGTYYEWQEGDDLKKVADFFKVDPEKILEYPGNRFDLTMANVEDPGIKPGRWLVIPDGKRKVQDWGPPAITRSNPASARYYGPGFCGKIYQGAVGTGAFVWPTTSHWISGYDYNAVVHPAIDIGGQIGTPIFAADAGVVVYAGWSNWGYGNLIVIDHGNGWQTAYAHLSSLAVGCGQSVFRGTQIGGMGSTGNSSGPHLHFEMVLNGAKLNPHNFLP